jgi:hypothetical protein
MRKHELKGNNTKTTEKWNQLGLKEEITFIGPKTSEKWTKIRKDV